MKSTANIEKNQLMWFQSIEDKMKKLERHLTIMGSAPARTLGRSTVRVPRQGGRGTVEVVLREGDSNQGQDQRPAVLMSNPKFLHVLWDEWTNGVNGSLPASEFTAEQRGRCRAKYSQRKVFWDCMLRLIRAGYTVQTSLQKINRVYSGNLTKQLRGLRRDEAIGGHNELLPGPVVSRRRRGRNSQ